MRDTGPEVPWPLPGLELGVLGIGALEKPRLHRPGRINQRKTDPSSTPHKASSPSLAFVTTQPPCPPLPLPTPQDACHP